MPEDLKKITLMSLALFVLLSGTSFALLNRTSSPEVIEPPNIVVPAPTENTVAPSTSAPSLKDFLTPSNEVQPKNEPSGISVTAIEIKGNKIVPTKTITDAVFTKVGDQFFDAKVDADIKAIYNLGFFSDVTADTPDHLEGKKVVYNVVENPILSGISFEGVSVFTPEALTSSMKTRPGDILNYTQLRSDIDNINGMYKNNGYILARVIDVAVEPSTSVLKVKVIEGLVESISIEGNDKTQGYVILRELNTKPGTPLNEKVLTKDLRRVYNLGFFSEVNPNFAPGKAPDKVVLVVNVKEQSTNTVNFGGGYGERDGWFGFVDLEVNNLFGTGQGLMMKGQSGQQSQTYQFKYFNPWVLEDKLGDHTSFTARRWYTVGSDVYFVGQNEIHNGWDLTLGKPFYEDVWRASVTLGGEWVGPYAGSTFEAYDSNTVGLSLSYDTRDNWLNPTEGVLHTLSLKTGVMYSSKTALFTKYGEDSNFFYPLAERQVLAFHLGAGLGVGDIPVGEDYWVGSANTVRGYSVYDAHVGTRKLLANLEYRYTFNEMFQGVLFYDWGDAWFEGAPDFAHFMSGTGVGVRVNTPLGPIRLDYGIAGGKNLGEGYLHFSIGQTF